MLQVNFDTTSFIDGGYNTPDSYEYWVPLLNYFLNQSDSIGLHCWNEEREVIEEIKSLFEESLETGFGGNLTTFKGSLNEEIKRYLVGNIFTKEGRLKWFTIFLKQNAITTNLLTSAHWGTEFFATVHDEKELILIKSFLPSEIIIETFGD